LPRATRSERTLVDQYPDQSGTEWLCVDVAGYKIINVYKPPCSRLTPTAIPTLPVCMLRTSAANMSTGVTAQHLLTVRNRPPWQQSTTALLQDLKGGPVSPLIDGTSTPTRTCPSRVSAMTTDRLTDVFIGRSRGHGTDSPSSKLKVSAYSDPVKCWNFCKDGWKGFCFLTWKSVDRFPTPDTTNIEKTYQELCESLLFAAKQCIPLRRRKNYVPCWDKECKTLCRSFVRAPVGTVPDRAASPHSFTARR